MSNIVKQAGAELGQAQLKLDPEPSLITLRFVALRKILMATLSATCKHSRLGIISQNLVTSMPTYLHTGCLRKKFLLGLDLYLKVDI